MRENLTRTVFDATASTYDKDRSRLVPGCDTFYRWALDLVPARAKVIVDLGAGSGLLTALLRDRFPQAKIYLVDFSAAMLDLARQRFGDDSHLDYVHADYVKDQLPDQVCCFVSSLSIHHLEDGDKRALFPKLFKLLKPNGTFVNADQVAGPTPDLEARYKALWLEQVRAAGATDQQIADSLFRQQEDRCASVEAQLAWMRDAGFADADCWYKEARFAVLAGTKR
jgi:tRNA (cmo5U34)-methyltransferase